MIILHHYETMSGNTVGRAGAYASLNDGAVGVGEVWQVDEEVVSDISRSMRRLSSWLWWW